MHSHRSFNRSKTGGAAMKYIGMAGIYVIGLLCILASLGAYAGGDYVGASVCALFSILILGSLLRKLI